MSSDSPRIYLFTPPAAVESSSIDAIVRALAAGEAAGHVACLTLDLAQTGKEAAQKAIAAIQPVCAEHGVALLANTLEAARFAAIDGYHATMTGEEPSHELVGAVVALKPGRIVGIGGLRSRHAAMSAGELDVDYVMFGEPQPDGFILPPEVTRDRTQWWSEIFNVPCVAFAPAIARVAPLLAAGADFIALGEAFWNHPRGPQAALAETLAAFAAADEMTGARQ